MNLDSRPDAPSGWTWNEVQPAAGPSHKEEDVVPPGSVRVPMFRFPGPAATVQSLKPISVRITSEQGGFLVDSETLRVFASGEQLEDAIREFVEQVVYFYGHYRALGENDVTGDAARIRRVYHEQFAAPNRL